MCLLKLDVYNIRNIRRTSISPSPTFNLIVGDNASGKSALLEAIHILGRAKSFRTNVLKSVIHFDQTELIVAGQVRQPESGLLQLGIQHDGKEASIRINQESKPRSELAYALPLQLIHPKSYELLDAGSQMRREFLDWGIFNDDRQFLAVWRRYKKALTQRNALLKSKQLTQLSVWNQEFAYYGTIVNQFRQRYLEKLLPVFTSICQNFLSFDDLALNMILGWDCSKALIEVLEKDLDRDLRYGYTHSGPHRADLQIKVRQFLAKDFVSRGQMKLLILSLKLAQAKLLENKGSYLGCILIDDFAAELDSDNRCKLLNFLVSLNCQVFITANSVVDFGDLKVLPDFKTFHVEQGIIKAN